MAVAANWRQPGDEVFIPKDALHSVRNIHHGTSVWLYGYGCGAYAKGP